MWNASACSCERSFESRAGGLEACVETAVAGRGGRGRGCVVWVGPGGDEFVGL